MLDKGGHKNDTDTHRFRGIIWYLKLNEMSHVSSEIMHWELVTAVCISLKTLTIFQDLSFTWKWRNRGFFLFESYIVDTISEVSILIYNSPIDNFLYILYKIKSRILNLLVGFNCLHRDTNVNVTHYAYKSKVNR